MGHALFNDFQVLEISVPPLIIRDTCSCGLLQGLYNASIRCNVSLKKLSLKLLNRTIQVRLGNRSVFFMRESWNIKLGVYVFSLLAA